MRKTILLYSLLLALPCSLYSQEKLLKSSSVDKRKAAIVQKTDTARVRALEFAQKYDIPVRKSYDDGRLIELRSISRTGIPQYYKTMNLNAAKTVSTDVVWPGGELGYSLNGNGMVVGVWDGGLVRVTHQEFVGRVRILDPQADEHYHATHVSGTIAAAGVVPAAKGMAHRSVVDSYDWNNDNEEMSEAAEEGLLVSNHSYGFIMGWDYNSSESRWEWYGEPAISETEDYRFGFYGTESRAWDEIAYENPYYLIVKSAGNDRGDGPGSGASHYVWTSTGWVESSTSRDRDGKGDQDCIETQATAKNILTVGSVQDLLDGFTNPDDVETSGFSAYGPTDDGRVKPDLVANGSQVYSTGTDSDTYYFNSSGTSMASANLSGSIILLQQHFYELYGTYMSSSALKAVAIHTADDAQTAGPDYQTGWGLLNTGNAANLISAKEGGNIIQDTLVSEQVGEILCYSDGSEDIKITIVWTDPPGRVLPASLDPKDTILVNDLDIRIIKNSDLSVYEPFVLDPENPFEAATTGDNGVDNVEQIIIKNPDAGFYRIQVTNKDTLLEDYQAYSLVISGMDKASVSDGEIQLSENNGSFELASVPLYLDNLNVKWIIQPDNNLPVSLYFDYFNSQQDFDKLYIYDGDTDASPLLAEFSGALMDSDTIIQSTDGAMLLVFVSDDAVVGEGFKGKYCTTAPVESVLLSGEIYPCLNSEYLYKVKGNDGLSYSWNIPAEWELLNEEENSVNLQVKTGEGTVSVQSYNKCGMGDEAILEIHPVSNVPSLGLISGDSLPCAGTETLYTINDLPGAVYNWIIPSEWSGSSDSSSISIIPQVEGVKFSVEAINACGVSETVTREITVDDVGRIGKIYAENRSICPGSDQVFYFDTIDGHTYDWSVEGDWSILEQRAIDTVLVRVGSQSGYVNLNYANRCGEDDQRQFFYVSNLPALPELSVSDDENGFKILSVSNMDDFESLIWFRDTIQLSPGENSLNSIIASVNGLYTVASVSEDNCINQLSASEGIQVDDERFTFVSYRVDPGTVIIENTLENETSFHIVNLLGNVIYSGTLQPGNNEIPFTNKGVFIVWLENGENKSSLKVAF